MVPLLGLAVTMLSIGSAAAATRAAPSGDQAILRAGVITANDVPSTWTAAKQSGNSAQAFKGMALCKPISVASAAAHKLPHKNSPEFSDPSNQGNTYAENTVYAFKTPAAVTKYLGAFRTGAFPTCLQQSLQKSLGTQGQVSPGQPVSNLQGVGDAALGYEFHVLVNVQGAQTTFVYDTIGVRIGRAFTGFVFASQNQQLADAPAIVNAVIGRVQSAAGG